jgi:hypothetical protein
MAQIQVNLDTTNKTLTVSIDGVSIPDVDDINAYTIRDSNGIVTALDISVYTSMIMDNGVKKRITYYAAGSAKAESAIASNQTVYKDVPGLIGVEDTSKKVAVEIDEFISSQKRAN